MNPTGKIVAALPMSGGFGWISAWQALARRLKRPVATHTGLDGADLPAFHACGRRLSML